MPPDDHGSAYDRARSARHLFDGTWGNEPPPEDPTDPGWTPPDEVVRAEPEPERAKPRPRPRPSRGSNNPPSRSGKPLVQIAAGKLDVITTEAEQAVIDSGVPVFQRGGEIMRPIVMEVAASHGRMASVPGLASMNTHALIDVFSTVAEWEKYDARAGDWVRTNPPKAVAEILLSRYGQWNTPVIAGVITTPTMRPDGSLIIEPGYDAATRLYHFADPSLVLARQVDHPSRADAERALALLRGLLVEFPLVETTRDGRIIKVSEAVALSSFITPVVRGALPVTPLHGFRANAPGSGKSYLADIASAIATGQICPAVSASSDEEETEKKLTGLLLAGFPIISLDNVNGEIGGDLLCQAIERPLIRIRPLGKSTIVEIESRSCIFANGNNMRVRGDMVRRSLIGDLDAGMERPETREFRSDPVATVFADRPRYVSACLIIVRAYLLAGQPGKLKPIASFNAWSDLVRSALVWLGCDDPAASMEEARQDDPVLAALLQVITTWDDAFGGTAMTVKRAVDEVGQMVASLDEHGERPMHGGRMEPRFPDLQQALLAVASIRGPKPAIDNRLLGNWLMGVKGRVVTVPGLGQRRFNRLPGLSMGAVQWKLEAKEGEQWR